MKKLLLLVTALLLISSGAFASKARMQALGQDAETGSYYVSDTRSVFTNPAYVNSYKNYIITEWGQTANQDDGGDANTPNPEGGFFHEFGDFSLGAYLGSEVTVNDSWKNLATGNVVKHQNPIDIFLAGDMGIKWGARVHFAKAKDETASTIGNETYEAKNSALGLGFGIIWNDLEIYADLLLSDKSNGLISTGNATTAKNATWEADLGMKGGISYNIFGLTVFGEYNKNGFGYNGGVSGDTKTTYERTDIIAGIGKIHEVAKNARLITDATFRMSEDEAKDASSLSTVNNLANTAITGFTKITSKTNSLKLSAGYEADATSWLTLRGAVSQTFLINSRQQKVDPAPTPNTNDKKDSNNPNTAVIAGATLNFGNLKVDGMIGHNSAAPVANSGELRTDELLSRVAVHYWF
ncbi:MAG: hypothetical protein KAQ98_05035 [Bacteriovoracaceae bacterium]|nr:hypothetical protein [Bacteriovoracaceae bacterium]